MSKVHLSEDLTPISDFRLRTAELVAKVKKTRRPIILTQHGRSAAVLEDVREYERKGERLELLEAIVAGLHAAEKGEVVSHIKAMAELNKILNA
ncbi:MAG TPA: type II toxin-antitoxin system Phd/YefM family antitoxin [Nitrospiraceae bacterium]|nr:type II toxin-antitoxin system Phd/YefM family antitoxin [Nitrospiraceae bacterium]